ncbi:class I SAM-dependent methyltransferase [Paraflavitalea sp. CAU 1676]|uniref:class I SAM-dependent methyltransferase n=1 Tax=Paraflavitalea sp. CAU 1676 TaxID=3032598 RepID=UPI0023DCC38E|nr:class I SAM-dependent methyltransferase [Paraflavitalea sp. CAU 1676]MDF2187592.1 class I SAM-dependent methyltransferase [Paraflavitalea sp. CAU 1676]
MQHSTRTFYNSLSFLYPAIDYFLRGNKMCLIEEVNRCVPGKLLEIGVGNGSHLSLYGSHQIVGIDISESMLRKAQRYKHERIELLLMDGENLLFPAACFDYVVISHVLAVTKDPDQLVNQIYQVLKPGGKLFILNHFTPANWLRYVDWAFQPLSALFHFRSSFHLTDVKALQRFSLEKQTELGKGSYFKLLICRKP